MTAKPIVAATDGSAESLRAVQWAAREAVLRGAPLRIVSVGELLPRMSAHRGTDNPETVADVILDDRDRALAEAAARAAETDPGLLIDTDPLDGPVAQTVTDAGSGALMLVVGHRGIGAFAALILGSVSRYAATHAPCPVVVVREETMALHQQVGVGIGDLAHSDHSEAPLTFAFEEAVLRKASLAVVHAWHAPHSGSAREGDASEAPGFEAEADSRLAGLLEDWQRKYADVTVTRDVVHGHPGRALAGLSARADLVVIGRRAEHHGPGTVMHAVLNHAHGPVATVPSA